MKQNKAMKLRLNSRHLLLLTYILSVSTDLLAQGPPSYVPSNGLVGWWPFTGNAIDSSGNGNNGTNNGATLTTDRYNINNSAYYFSGAGCATRIDVNVNTSSISSGLTFSYWYLQSGNGCIAPRTFEFYSPSQGPGFMQIQNWNSFNSVSYVNGSNQGVALSAPSTQNNVWAHLVFTHDGKTAKLYKNGVLVDSKSNIGSCPLFNKMCVGRMDHPAYDAHQGKIDDIGIWNRALSECEILQLHSSQVITTPSLSIGRDTSLCKLDSFKISASSGFKSYLWSTNDTSRSVYIKTSQKISVIATDSLGCKAYDTATISLLNPKISPRDTVVCKGLQLKLSSKINQIGFTNTTCGYMSNALKSGLVAWYPFCGNANDESGNGNTGTVSGATLTTDRSSGNNSAYSFNGSSNYISLAQPFFNGSNSVAQFTFSIWCNVSQLPIGSDVALITKEGFWRTHYIALRPNGSIAYGASQPNPQGYISVASSAGTISVGVWQNIIVTYINSVLKLYINGNLVQTSNISYSTLDFSYLTMGNSTATTLIGAYNPASGLTSFFNGKIDDFGIWNRALTATEISQLYSIQNQSSIALKWSTVDTTSSTTLIANANTQVWLKATDGIGTCYDTTNVYVRQASVSIGADTIRVCKADSIQLTATKGFKSYLWSNGTKSDSIFVKSSEKITLNVIDSIGCQANDTSVVSVLNPKISPRDTVVCKSTQVTLRGSINSASSSNTTCGYMPNALKSGLVAWYPFCGNANDESGNGNHGTVNGAILSTDRFGNSGKAYSFDGVNDYISSSRVYQNTFSVSLWYNPFIDNSYNPLIDAFDSHWEIQLKNTYPDYISFIANNSYTELIATTATPKNNWYHLTCTYLNNNLKIYINGILVNQFTANALPVNNGNYIIGASLSGADQYFNGKLDDIGIWNRALSAAEVAELYTLQSVAYPPKLSWSTSDSTTTTKITPLATTKLWLKASNGIGVCYDTTSVIVSKPVINLQDTILFTNCKRDSMMVNIGSAWKSVNWSNGGNDSTTWLKTTGKYFVSAIDQYGCLANDSSYFFNPGKPKITGIVSDSVNCFGGKDGSLNASASGGFMPLRYLWNDAAKQSTAKASGLSKGSYKLIIEDAYNCKDSLNATVKEPLKLQLSLSSSDSVNCFGGSDGSLKVSSTGGNGGNTFLWNDPNTQSTATAINLKAGSYKVRVTDFNGCMDTLTALVYQPTKVVASISTFKNAKCFGYSDGSILGNGTGGTGTLKYNWNTLPAQNTAQATNLSKGTYLLTITDVYGCFDTISGYVSEPSKIVPLISAKRLAVKDIPHQLNSTVSPVQTYTYQWTPGSVFGSSTNKPAINGKFQTTTLVTLRTTDNNGCFGEDTATITVLIPFGDFIPTVFSPNADNHNDVFGLPDIFEVEQLDIYNRWGELLFSGSATNPNWDGLYKGEFVPQGTYIYMIKASLKGTDYKFEHQGTISVVR